MTESSKIPLSAIVEAVGSHFGVGRREILGESRHASVIMPRQIVYYLAVRLCSHKSTTGIGRELGRDHSTLIHGKNKIGKMRKEVPELGAVIDQLEEKIRSGTYVNNRDRLAAISKSYMAAQQNGGSLLKPKVQSLADGNGVDDKARETPEDTWPI